MKKKLYDDSWMYILLLTTLIILTESIKGYTFKLLGYDISFSIILIPLIFIISNFITKKYSHKKTIFAISISTLCLILYLFIMCFAIGKEFIITDIIGDIGAYLAAQLINLILCTFLIYNTKPNAILIFSTYLLSLIGITVGEGTGFIETFTRRHLSKIPKAALTFLVIFIAITSSLINEVGYAILIPLVAIVYFINNRNPILGIVTAFCGVSFGYGVSIFVGSMEMALMNYTKDAAMLIDDTTHIALSSNLIFIIVTTIILSIVGTFTIEKIIAPRIGKYKKDDEFSKTETYKVINIEEEEQRLIEKDKYEKKGLRSALVVSIIVLLIFIYSLIPNLPFSGLLLDMNENTYVNQLFGENSYFQDGFTYLVSLLFVLAGIAYGFGSKSIKNDKEIIENASKRFSGIGSIFILIFVVSQFIAVFRKSNIGMIITAWLASLLEHMTLGGIPLIIISLFVANTSHATWLFSSTAKQASKTASEIWSHTLSG